MNPIPDDKFTEWTIRLQKADEQAFSEMFRLTYNPLLAYACHILASREAAKDILQEVYTKIWNIRESLDENKSLKALMYHIARNLCYNHLRDFPGNVPIEENDLMDNHQADASLADDRNAFIQKKLPKWIEELPERQQEAFEMSRMEGLNHKEIAQVMKCSPATVNNHIVNALNNLRKKLSEFESLNPD